MLPGNHVQGFQEETARTQRVPTASSPGVLSFGEISSKLGGRSATGWTPFWVSFSWALCRVETRSRP